MNPSQISSLANELRNMTIDDIDRLPEIYSKIPRDCRKLCDELCRRQLEDWNPAYLANCAVYLHKNCRTTNARNAVMDNHILNVGLSRDQFVAVAEKATGFRVIEDQRPKPGETCRHCRSSRDLSQCIIDERWYCFRHKMDLMYPNIIKYLDGVKHEIIRVHDGDDGEYYPRFLE